MIDVTTVKLPKIKEVQMVNVIKMLIGNACYKNSIYTEKER